MCCSLSSAIIADETKRTDSSLVWLVTLYCSALTWQVLFLDAIELDVVLIISGITVSWFLCLWERRSGTGVDRSVLYGCCDVSRDVRKRYNGLHYSVADDIASTQLSEAISGTSLSVCWTSRKPLFRLNVDLGDISGYNHSRAKANSGEKHLHLFGGGVWASSRMMKLSFMFCRA